MNKNPKIGKFIKDTVLFLFCTVVLLEVIGFLSINFRGGIPPNYMISEAFKPNFHADIDETFGVWHPENTHRVFESSCFRADYFSNSYGARDFERSQQSNKERVFVIGDSYFEGFGLDTTFRLTNLLEKATEKEFLNFATGGHFGPVQYFLLYKKMSAQYEHSELLVGLSLPNDFLDNDIEYWKNKDRYRPFWIGEFPNYELKYQESELESSTYKLNPSNVEKIEKLKKSTSWFYSMVDYATKGDIDAYLWKTKKYTPYKKKQLENLVFSMDKIIETAKKRNVVFCSVPNFQSMSWHRAGITPNYITYIQNYLEKKNLDNVKFVYLEPKLNEENLKSYFFECNEHWSEAGTKLISKAVLEEIY